MGHAMIGMKGAWQRRAETKELWADMTEADLLQRQWIYDGDEGPTPAGKGGVDYGLRCDHERGNSRARGASYKEIAPGRGTIIELNFANNPYYEVGMFHLSAPRQQIRRSPSLYMQHWTMMRRRTRKVGDYSKFRCKI
jgi:hypothetical protein